MLTASYVNFSGWEMKDDYREAVGAEMRTNRALNPVDFGDISAPLCLPAGSQYSYRLRWGVYTDMPSAALR